MLKFKQTGMFGALILLFFGTAANNIMNSAHAHQDQSAIATLTDEPTSTDVGIATFTLNPDGTSLHYVLKVTHYIYESIYTWRDIDISDVTGAYIHAYRIVQPHYRLVPGPVLAGLFNRSMIGHPTGEVNGILKGNITASNLTGPLSGKHLSDLVNQINTGLTYIKVHTTRELEQDGDIWGVIRPWH
jgi:hypothetical protein